MSALDWVVVTVYLGLLLGIGWYFSRRQTSKSEYYLGGKGLNFVELGVSTIATQLSAISFISAPAFVGYRQGGGLKWLAFEFAVPLAMLFLIVFIMPPLYRAGIVSVYQFLEHRFGASTRRLLSAVFLFSRSFAVGIMVYATALVLSAVLGIEIWMTILVAGAITAVYSVMGGLKAVIYTDILQMIILIIGIMACGWIGLEMLGGWEQLRASVDRERLNAVDFSAWGLGGDGDFGFWPMVLGGFFLYCAYYGTDQSQVQRNLGARDYGQLRSALLLNGLMRFPITFLYCFMGLILGAVAFATPELAAKIPAERPDMLVPIFIADYLPAGLVGLLIISVLAAAMSTMSSTFNSLAAVTMEDFIVPLRANKLDERQYVQLSKLFTLAWAGVCIAVAFVAGDIAKTVIEAINKVGSLFYGPVFATFVVAILARRPTALAMNIALAAGVAVNFVLWTFFSAQVFWFWWNLTGFVATVAVAAVCYGAGMRGAVTPLEFSQDARDSLSGVWRREAPLLIGYFVFMVLFSLSIAYWL
jgi:solute carrier family 5 (sodium-dependent multivitamin transporter), member 6